MENFRTKRKSHFVSVIKLIPPFRIHIVLGQSPEHFHKYNVHDLAQVSLEPYQYNTYVFIFDLYSTN